MKIYCINLARSADRRAFQLAQAQRLGLDIEFIDAVDFKGLSESTLHEAAQHWTRPIVGKDVGCFHSHQKAWQQVAKGKEPAMILEDDIVFSNVLPEVLQALSGQHFPQNRVYDLEYAPRKHVLAKKPIWKAGSVMATRMFINKVGAGCYVISPWVAQNLLNNVATYAMVDSWLWTRPWIEQVQIEPCASAQSRDLEVSAKNIQLSTAGPQPKEYAPISWFRAKQIRLALTFDQLGSFILALMFGKQRMLKFMPEQFSVYPERCHSDAAEH